MVSGAMSRFVAGMTCKVGLSLRTSLVTVILLVAAALYLLLCNAGISRFSAAPVPSQDAGPQAVTMATFRDGPQSTVAAYNKADTTGAKPPDGCPEGLSGMLQGNWERRPMTPDDVKRIKTFLTHVREEQFNMPKGLQRDDKRCGNLTHNPRPNLQDDWFRALCDEDGPTPCCFSNHSCAAKTIEECKCTGCLDMRTQLHAEYATWRTSNPSCQPLTLNQSELCRLLENSTFYFMGDSMMRHVHTAMLLTVRDNDETGAFRDNMPKDVQDRCRNLYMFTEKECRHHVANDVKVCDGRVLLRYMGYAYNTNGPAIRNDIAGLRNQSRSVVVVGLGFHGGLNAAATFKDVTQPLLEQMKRENWAWPKVLWASTHSFNVLKNPNIPGQQPPDVLRFNRETEELFAPYLPPSAAVPLYVFNTFNMTAPLASFDGTHYGMGANKMKANILLNFIRRLRDEGLW